MNDRRSFLSHLVAGAFGLAAGQVVKVEPVEAKIEPATVAMLPVQHGGVMFETWHFPSVYLDSIEVIPDRKMIERRLLGRTDKIYLHHEEHRINLSFVANSTGHTVTFAEAAESKLHQNLEITIRCARP